MSGSFTETFGGSSVRPSDPSYLALTIAVDTALVWPLETTSSSPVVAAMLSVTTSTGGLELAMPPGDTGSTGVATMIVNAGSNTFTLTDQGGNAIVSIPTTQAWLIALVDNSTTNGTWTALQMASTTSSAVAAALAGPGLKAVGPLLELNYVPVAQSADVLLTASFRAKVLQWTGSIDGTMQLDTLANLTAGWSTMISNNSALNVYLTTSGGQTIDGLSGRQIKPGQSVLVVAGTSQFVTFGLLLEVLPITQGGTGAATAPDALINLGGTSLGIAIFTAPSAASVIALLGLNNFTFREVTVSSNQVVNSSSGNTAYVATAPVTFTLPLTTDLTTSFIIAVYAQGGLATFAPQATDKINDGSAGANYTIREDGFVLLGTDANGNWWPIFQMGDVMVGKSLNISGNADIGGDLAVDGSAAVAVDLNVGDGLTVGGDAGVTGGLSVGGNVGVTGTMAVGGILTAANGTSGTQVVNHSQFPATLGGTGTMTLPSGVIEKWGTGTCVAGSALVSFVAPFPTSCDNVVLSINGAGATLSVHPIAVGAVSSAGFTAFTDAGEAPTFFWRAIGH